MTVSCGPVGGATHKAGPNKIQITARIASIEWAIPDGVVPSIVRRSPTRLLIGGNEGAQLLAGRQSFFALVALRDPLPYFLRETTQAVIGAPTPGLHLLQPVMRTPGR